MFFLRVFLMAFRGLRANLLRSFLATLGVIIGVSAVVSAMSILEGAQRDIGGRIESMGADQLFIRPSAGQRQARHLINPTLTLNDADALRDRRNCPLIQEVAPEFSFSDTVQYFSKNKAVTVLSTSAEFSNINNYEAVKGRFLTTDDVRGERKVCVLGYKLARDLFGHAPALDKRIRIRGLVFTVVGVMEKKGVILGHEVDDQVFVPITTGMQRMMRSRFVQMIAVKCRSAEELAKCKLDVERTLRKEHGLRPGAESDFGIFDIQFMQEQLDYFRMMFGTVLYSIAGISLVVGGIGIMNIMLVSVTERTREIGVRMAVGARRGDILRHFLIEANVISILGGALGIGLGVVFIDLLKEITGQLNPYLAPSIIIWALAMAITVGIISGIYPAFRASRLDPVDALRFE